MGKTLKYIKQKKSKKYLKIKILKIFSGFFLQRIFADNSSKSECWYGEMYLRILAAYPEGPASIPSTHMAAQNHF